MQISLETLKTMFGAGEIWAFSSAMAYSLDNVFTAFAVRAEPINFYLGASLRSIPVLIFTLLATVFFRKSNKPTLSPFSDIKIIMALSAHGILAFFLGTPCFLEHCRKAVC